MDNEEVRIVKQYHYTTWPDFGVPATPSDFIQFLQDVRDSGGLGPGTDEEYKIIKHDLYLISFSNES